MPWLAFLVIALSLPASVSLAGDLDAARAALDRRDYAGAVPLLAPLAESGDAEAQFRLGTLYQTGRGIEQDTRRAADYFAAAAQQGHAEAQVQYGILLLEGGEIEINPRKAALWLSMAANQNQAQAQYLLGLMHFKGIGVHKDEVAGTLWLEKAAGQGWREAQRSLAQIFSRGINGMPPDKERARFWLERSLGKIYYRNAADGRLAAR